MDARVTRFPAAAAFPVLVLWRLARRGFVWEHRERQMIGVNDEIPRCIVVGWVHGELAEVLSISASSGLGDLGLWLFRGG